MRNFAVPGRYLGQESILRFIGPEGQYRVHG
jgi:hypothetical protein